MAQPCPFLQPQVAKLPEMCDGGLMEMEIPQVIPVMTLSGTVFFPQTVLPLHIFEPRYREMLRDVLATHRVFAIVKEKSRTGPEDLTFEPPHEVATAGMIRLCQEAPDGTSNLVLQGICRMKVIRVVRENPYRMIEVEPLQSEPGASPAALKTARSRLLRIVEERLELSSQGGEEMLDLLRKIEDHDIFADLAAFTFCDEVEVKQELLETLATSRRLAKLSRLLQDQVERLRLSRKLQGGLPDSDISSN